jgi:integrase
LALDARKLKLKGIDPIEARRSERTARQLEAAKAISFKQAADGYIKANRAAWKNAKHAAQWEATLAAYAEPVFGSLPVARVDTALVMKAVEPIWSIKPETASRLRGRIETVLDWATVRGYRQGENPARWRGHLDKLLPAKAKVRTVEHHAALPWKDLPKFMKALRTSDFVFPGGKADRPLSNMALLTTLKRMKRGDLTTHGFRSTFRDWAAETTDHPGEVIEMALAHVVANKVEAA